MKTLIPALLLVTAQMAFSQMKTASTAPGPADLEALPVPASSRHLSDHLLDRFNEPRLDKGTPDGRAIIRITALRSSQSPVMLMWYPEHRDGTSILHVKMLELDKEKNTTGYARITFDRKITLTESQTKSLKALYVMAPIQSLPKETWQSERINGSVWIFEAAAGKESVLIHRYNPVKPDLESHPVSPERIAKELQLTSFALNLWVLANVDELPH